VAPERLLDAAMDEDTGCSLCQRYDGNAQCPCGIAVIGAEDNDATSSMHGTMAGGTASRYRRQQRVDLYISIVLLAWSLARSDEINLSAIAVGRENCSL
jgi:hypothetical protein